MPTPFDVSGTITPKIALIILVIVLAGLVLAFTRLSLVGYILLATAAALYVVASIASLLRVRK